MYYLSRNKFVRCSYFLDVGAIGYNLNSSNPGTSKHPHMSNRIYDTLDSEYRVYFLTFLNMQCFVGTKKNRLHETLVLCIQTHIFVRLKPSVRLEKNNKFCNQAPLSSNY